MTAPRQAARTGRLASAIAGLFPGYFALVMATGIVSIAGHWLGWPRIAQALLVVNLPAYAVLVLLTLARLVRFPRELAADFADHARGSGYFTTVAATCVLGSQCLLVAGWRGAAEVLLAAGILLWPVVMYAFFTAVIVRQAKPTLEQGINGAWLLATVASQSVAVLALTLGDPFGWPREAVALGSLMFFLVGCMLYLAIITLIFYRFTFLPIATAALSPPYWINMGAVAITTLAGSALVLGRADSPLITEITPFLKGFTLFFWAAAGWWIPLLLLLGVWRHVVRRYPLTYDPQYWGMVFPLGMYSVATFRLSAALPYPPLAGLAHAFYPLAVVAWLATFAGLLFRLVGRGEWGPGDAGAGAGADRQVG